MKLLSLTTSPAELQALIPLLRELYFSCTVDGLSLLGGPAEAELKANPWIHRMLAEFTVPPREGPLDLKELCAAARRAVIEERPDVVLFPAGSPFEGTLSSCLREAGIGEYVVRPGPPPPLGHLLAELKNRHIASVALQSEGINPKSFIEPHWDAIDRWLSEGSGPCLLLGHQTLTRECRAQFPHHELHDEPRSDRYESGLALFALSYTDQPAPVLQTLRRYCARTLLLEPVNTQMVGGRFTVRYGDYDNEFAFVPAEVDLKQVLDQPHSVAVWSDRSGRAGKGPLPNTDGCHPLFALSLEQSTADWTDRYALPADSRLKIVFADSGNVAGSVLHHARAVNANTSSQAWALALNPHPLIGVQQNDERTFFVQGMQGKPTAALEQVLREADCFVFFEDDDERSPAWPFPLHPYVEGKPVLHLYIGYRVHQRTPQLQRVGRRILTPLPHILRMYPHAYFYAGFPPQELLDIPLAPPRSEQDGICRILHSPSVPHWTTARYPYHKDTEAFLHAARVLKKRFKDKLEIHQVGGWSHSEVLRARQICDITFNQLRGFHGLSGDEAMLLERPCVQAFDQANFNRHREYWGFEDDFPWLTTSREGLVASLAGLVEDPLRRAEIGRLSRAFMLKYFSPQKGILPLLCHCYQATSGAR